MSNLCDGRVVLVTGAGRGIGREHALSLARHGAAVVVNDLGAQVTGDGSDAGPAQSVVDEIKAFGGSAIADGGNVADWDQAQAMVDRAVSEFGRLDAVVNNAGILRDRMLVNMSPQEWDSVVAVHLRGTFNVTRHAAAAAPAADAAELGPVIANLLARARPNANMFGVDAEGPGRPTASPAAAPT